MIKSILINMPTAVLWQFREFKRDETPAPRFSFITSYNVDEVTEYIQERGSIEPVELAVIGTRALLTDGNHRIVAARRLGYKMIPVKLVIVFGDSSNVYSDHTLKRFKPISKHLELWLKRFFFTMDLKRQPKVFVPKDLLKSINFSNHPHLN